MNITYPDLPISRRRDDILAVLREHQVMVVVGETGSGKTTQLPKMAMELAGDRPGRVGCTQPRRLAAGFRSPAVWRKNWAANWAAWWGTRCGLKKRRDRIRV